MQKISIHTGLNNRNTITCEAASTFADKKHFIIAISAMVIITAASNYLVEIPLGDFLTWGAFTYPFSFLVSELMNRFYGPRKARQVVYIGFLVAVFLAFIWMNRRIAFASSLAFLVGQLLDISLFNKFRRGSWWLAPVIASFSASLMDTVIFFSVAFAETEVPWIQLAIGDFSVKMSMDVCLLLPFRLFLWREKKQSPVTLSLQNS